VGKNRTCRETFHGKSIVNLGFKKSSENREVGIAAARAMCYFTFQQASIGYEQAAVCLTSAETRNMIGCSALSPKELKLTLASLKGRYALRDRALIILESDRD
jgi:hypothetical protein